MKTLSQSVCSVFVSGLSGSVAVKIMDLLAALVDITSFDQMELIIDNLLNREEEPEDAILAASAVLQRLVAQARQEPSSPDWERELDEL